MRLRASNAMRARVSTKKRVPASLIADLRGLITMLSEKPMGNIVSSIESLILKKSG